MFSWFRLNRQRGKIREDRKYLEPRVRRFLRDYLSSDEIQKRRYYEVVAGAAAGCQPSITDSKLESVQFAQASAEVALKVVKVRVRRGIDDNDEIKGLITDAYATVAIAYRRAAAAYTMDEEMLQLGTAAVHLLTIATSYMTAQSEDIADK
ncbi:hypothetical protein [Bradyrhizobium sp. AUGA SZCCT0431]|uniref:hypothetical protein n=1 Tax=Bradyrhizobium sp. AUGA SZCCT0431 TaxID=2807674 RepID=UPI001BAAE60D|nr:hypothetical protein [Bradyrhizobium sp. AUGA SZCCT0431]MBR1143043.1 hypothetical protein [Bradyrhizobium sp. AUGA SZCCT0431]